jgi:hypothetical protein
MKRFSALVLISFACLVPLAWAQQSAGSPRAGKQWQLRQRIMNRMPRTPGQTGNLGVYGSASFATGLKTWDISHYPDGTWADLNSINNFGVAVGWGDVASNDTRLIGVPLLGRDAGKWFECGVTSGASAADLWVDEGGTISDTGLIVGNVRGQDGKQKAYVWTARDAGAELGALEGDLGSAAIAVNHIGTLIVGLSYADTKATPVAWTPEPGYRQGKPAITWKIHKLSTGGLDQPEAVFAGVTLAWWGGWGVNDLGQIVGDGWSDNYDELAVVWTPVRGGRDWTIQQLPHHSSYGFIADHVYTEALSINDLGQIAGDASSDYWSSTMPAIWKLSPRTHAWELTELPTLSGVRSGWNVVWAINEIGDVVGQSTPVYDPDNWTSIAARWLIKDSSFVKAMGFPGDWSSARQVNNFGIAVGAYSSGGGPSLAFAAAIR